MCRHLKLVSLLIFLCADFLPAVAVNGNKAPALFPIWNAQHKTGYIDVTGKIIIPPRFESGSDFSEGLAAVNIGGKWGFVDHAGNVTIAPAYYAAFPFSDGVAAVYEFGEPIRRCGYIDHTDHFVIELQSKFSCKPFKEGFAVVDLYNDAIGEDLSGYIDKGGNIPIGASYVFAGDFSNGLALVHDSDKRVFIDRTGSTVIDLSGYAGRDTLSDQYEPSGPFGEGLAEVGIKIFSQYGYARYGFVNQRGKIAFELPPELTVKGLFHDGRALILRQSTEHVTVRLGSGEIIRMTEQAARFGYINRSGKFAVQARFSDALDFSDGLAAVLTGSPRPVNQRDIAGSAIETRITDGPGTWKCIDVKGNVRIARCGVPLSRDELQKNFTLARDGFGRGFVNGLFFSIISSNKTIEEAVLAKEFGYMNKLGKFVWISPEAEKQLPRAWLRKNFVGQS